MFWRFGGYANISTIDTILEKEHFQLEDLLDESDLIQELKQHNAKLVEYLREQHILEKLLEYVVAPRLEPVASPEDEDDEEGKGKGISLPFTRPRASSKAGATEEDQEKKRNRYAFVAAEILSSDNWSIYEALMENRQLLRNFWQFLKRPAPLDPLQASYFTKVNESLFDKKTEEMLDLLKSLENAVPDMIKHVDCPMIMDLLLKIISLERTESGQGIVEWLYTQDVVPTLLSYLGPENSWATQTSAGDFMKAIITVSANASQNEQTCVGPNELTRQLVSKPCVEQLIKYMLGGGNPLTVGVGIVIEVIRKNNSDYDPDGPETSTVPSSRDPIYLGTLLRLFAEHVPDFMHLVMNAPSQKQRLDSTFGYKIEPLGFDRFKTCELMAELLHCSNMGLLNEAGSEEIISARDAERQRLRVEGKLTFLRGEEAPSSVEDLTMRLSHSSPTDEGRRLEVTNSSADDDGFEEVTHTGDDDASHGIEDIPDLPDFAPTATGTTASSFLDKDEDDFVDEPLSSPRLNVRELENAEVNNAFEDPELAVAPLSPSKQKAPEPTFDGENNQAGVSGEQSEEAEVGIEQEPLKADAATSCDASHSEKSESSDTQPPTPSSTADLDSSVEAVEGRNTSAENFSPLPEDTPAPLFSSQRAPDATSTAQTDESDPKRTADETEMACVAQAPAVAAQDAGEVSIVIAHANDAAPPSTDSHRQPVVGDFLKMQFVENRVVPTILSFFFEFPWNNFLHNVVYDIVQQVFNGPMDRGYNSALAISLFEQADVTAQIINGQVASEESQAMNKTRMGYMGHLTLIAEEVVKFTERHPPELLSETVLEKVMAQDWINYVEGALAETRERDNAILGGVRPEVAMSNRAGAGAASSLAGIGLGALGLGGGSGSTALADAGLNGGSEQHNASGNGIGPFAISAGTLMSGFGSSSDEDEDEEQESEEDVNNEFRAYTDPLNANTSNSMNPPSIPPPPPPPPPLNVPPSRARLQFAARLAMNKRNAVPGAGGTNGQEGDGMDEEAESDSFNLPNVSTNEHLRNPFADGDDDEEGEDGSGSGSDDDKDGGEGGVGSSGWNRGSWWRGVVRSARRGTRNRRASDDSAEPGNNEVERFGDGRDDDSSDDGAGIGDADEDMDDEEFGDFAMPEVDGAKEPEASGQGSVSGIDPAREKILLKPLPVHPGNRTSPSPFGSLWPFSGQGFGAKNNEKEGNITHVDAGTAIQAQEGEIVNEKVSEEPVQIEDRDTVMDEDGNKIGRAIEAKRRTSIEDPDEDDSVVGEGIIVGRPSLS